MTNNKRSQPLSEEEKMLAAGYVLGDLTDEETSQVEFLAVQNPALLREIHALQVSYELMPQALDKVNPPADLLEVKLVDVKLVKPSGPFSRQMFRWLAGLAMLAALGLAADNLRLRYRLQLVQQGQPDRVAEILQQPNSRLISLTGDDTDAAGTLLFTPGNWQEVIISFGNLPALPPDQIYRMWLALENGEVIYCGSFNTDNEGSVFVRFTPPETPPSGVKATELFVTIDADTTLPDPSGERVMQGTI